MASNIMDHQKKFMYIFERLSEPLCMGPRGNGIYFDVPTDDMDPKTKKVSTMFRDMLAKQNMRPAEMLQVQKPAQMPDLSMIGRGCKRSEIFSWFIPSHQKAAAELKKALMDAPDREAFINLVVACRDNPAINSGLFVHAVMAAALERADMRGIRLPALWEVMPDVFVPPSVRIIANRQAALPTTERSVIKVNGPIRAVERNGRMADVTINASFSGRNNNLENKLWYFREDVGVASHHWHWHVVYGNATYDGPDAKDRKGELFYYMHHSMLGRYEAERLANGLERTKPLDLSTRPVIEEGYFGKLVSENSGKIWGTRQERSQVQDVDRGTTKVDIEDIRKWKDRILEAIDTGFIMTKDGRRLKLTPEKGIDLLGHIVQNGGPDSLNPQFYGNLHNMGHVLIAYSHDPQQRHNEQEGPMGHEATAMKDPAFYRWHKFVDQIFDKYKQILPGYTEAELLWPGIRIKEAKVNTPNRDPNTLYTHWMQSDIDLSRGLDLSRTSSMTQGPVWARFTHLTHENFQYEIRVENNTGTASTASVRIFIAPRLDEQGERLSYSQQRKLFFEQDKFFVKLNPGPNRIVRNSTESSVTIPWESTFRDLEQLIQGNNGKDLKPEDAVCGCGWPQHLLVPRGTPEGMDFDLFVMITNGREDAVKRTSTDKRPPCKESLSYCGILNDKYPDAKPMGFPFDRKARDNIGGPMETESSPNLDDFVIPDSNMAVAQIRIVYEPEKMDTRGNGASADVDVIEPLDAVSKDHSAVNFTATPGATSRSRPPTGRTARQDNPGRLDDWAYDSSPERFYD